jgi:outer membrane biosynthesis protein TonB
VSAGGDPTRRSREAKTGTESLARFASLRQGYGRMTTSRAHEASLRPGRPEIRSLARAFALSLALHLLVWGTYSGGNHFKLWEKLRWPDGVRRIVQATPKPPKQPEKPRDTQPPLVYVDVTAAQATSEVPKDTPFYSDKNALAANPESEKDTDTPKITGTQTQVVRTEDVPRNPFDQLMPDPPKPAKEPAEEARPKPVSAPGDLTMSKPDLNPRPDQGEAERARPRTIAEAMARNRLVGQKMQQDGGVRPQRLEASFDTRATATGAYDRAFIDAVASRWHDLLDNMSYDGYRRGMVVVQFDLNYDGRITNMKVIENTVTGTLALLCEKAVSDPSPFEKWSREMRLTIGKDSREIKFTFFYN